jgi:hypothetical protein
MHLLNLPICRAPLGQLGKLEALLSKHFCTNSISPPASLLLPPCAPKSRVHEAWDAFPGKVKAKTVVCTKAEGLWSSGSPPRPLSGMPAEDLQRLLPLDVVPGDAGAAWRWQWPPGVEYALQALAAGPSTSQVASGEMLGEAILDMRRELKLGRCNAKLVDGLHTFFAEVRPRTTA